MRVVSIINYKGGVGKTTVTANLAGELAKRGRKVLLLDLDSQTSLTFSFISPEEWRRDFAAAQNIKTWFKKAFGSSPLPLTDFIFEPKTVKAVLNGNGKLGLIASHLDLLGIDMELATLLSGKNLQQAKWKFLKIHGSLEEALKLIPSGTFDIVLIDCPPNFNIVTKSAIVASDYILIPTKPDFLSTAGIDYLMRQIKNLVYDYNFCIRIDGNAIRNETHPKILGGVFTMIQIQDGKPIGAQRSFITQRENLDFPVFETFIRANNTLYANAPQDSIPVILKSEHSSGPHLQIVEELRGFVTEFEKKLGSENGEKP